MKQQNKKTKKQKKPQRLKYGGKKVKYVTHKNDLWIVTGTLKIQTGAVNMQFVCGTGSCLCAIYTFSFTHVSATD